MQASDAVVGCGSTVCMDSLPFHGRLMLQTWNLISRLCRWAAGSFILCRADAFREVGGFDEELYASEEIDFSRRLKRWGRAHGRSFTILSRHPLESSNRKMRLYSPGEVLRYMFFFLLMPRRSMCSRKYLDMWYDGRR